MNIKFKRISMVLLLLISQISAIMAESGAVGDQIRLVLNPETEPTYPDLLKSSCNWDIINGDKKAINLTPVQDQCTVTILSYFSGTIRIRCSYQIWDSHDLSKRGKNMLAYFDITCNSEPNPPGPGPIPTPPSIIDYNVTENTIEGIPMSFFITKDVYGAIIACLQQNCIYSANGRVTIPDYAKGYPLRTIDYQAFHSLSGLTELVIPETVAYVSEITSGCYNLETIICKAYYPPTATMSQITDVDWKCTLYVPQGTKSLYMEAKGWKDFKAIKEIGGVDVEGIDITSNNFPDANFRQYLLEQNYGKDGVITDEEINGITSISIFSEVSNLKGIEYFRNLENLSIKSDKLTSLNVSNLSALYLLFLYSGKLKSYVLEDIINTLPLNVYTKRHSIIVGDEKLLSSQLIAKTRTLGWTPNYMDGFTSYKEYPGDNPTGINLMKSSLTINEGESTTMGYTMTPSSSVRDVTWNSDDSSIASVDNKGVVRGRKQGTTYINARTPNGITGSCKVTVIDPNSIQSIKMDTYSDAPIYNLNGQRMDKPRKGINIIGGKKVLIK